MEPLSHTGMTLCHPGHQIHRSIKARRFLFTRTRVLMMVSLVYFLGFLIAIPLYMLLYLRGRSGEGWPLSLAMAGAMWSLPYGLFHLVLRTHLYEGLLWRWLGL